MFILLISDIHGNYPALQAIEKDVANVALDLVINCGDSTVYGSFPNETLKWLRKNKAVSILGNTDRKVIKLLKGHDFKKPSKPEKRVMYTWTAEVLKKKNRKYLCSLPDERHIETEGITIGIFHGSPEDRDEFLFPDTDQNRFEELAGLAGCDIIVTGHSHTPFDKNLKQSRFINPGSCGRMFDGNPMASYALLEIVGDTIRVDLRRIAYSIEKTMAGLKKSGLPEIYCEMYRLGRKLN